MALPVGDPKQSDHDPAAGGGPVPRVGNEQAASAVIGLAAAEEELRLGMPEAETEEEQDGHIEATEWDGDLPETLFKVVDARIAIWYKLLDLDRKRHAFRRRPISELVAHELARQSRELQRLPSAGSLQSALKHLAEELKPPSPVGNDDDGDDGDEEDDEDDEDSAGAAGSVSADAPAEDPAYRQLLTIGVAQAKLLLAREQANPLIPKAAIPLSQHEPLVSICRQHNVDAMTLLGWTFYAVGLEQRIAHYRRQEREHRGREDQADRKSRREGGGLRSIFGGKAKDSDALGLDPDIPKRRRAAEREYRSIQRTLSDHFWALYEEVAWLLAADRILPPDQPEARAFLRYGFVSVHPAVIQPEKLANILHDCSSDVWTWEDTLDGVPVVYPDEYIHAVVNRQTTASPDEEVELNRRGTPEWRADRVWRNAVINATRLSLFQAEFTRLRAVIGELEASVRADEAKLLELQGSTNKKKRKREAAELDKRLLAIRGRIGRAVKAAEKLHLKFIPEVRVQAGAAASKLGDAMCALSPEAVARREARFMRRLARLTARLKEPFAAFVLRDWFEPGRSDHHCRADARDAVARLEAADPRMFDQVLLPSKDLDKRVTVRTAPTFLIVPARGLMGISINPRKNNDSGRLVLPLLSQRPNQLDGMLLDILADFRWDCSMEEAGIDWITADALCAAYATVRWNYRNRPEHLQRKAGIDRKAKDRQNWRVHYKLFVTSAADRGRRLFNKCLDAYNCAVQYVGLPEGQEPLKRE